MNFRARGDAIDEMELQSFGGGESPAGEPDLGCDLEPAVADYAWQTTACGVDAACCY